MPDPGCFVASKLGLENAPCRACGLIDLPVGLNFIQGDVRFFPHEPNMTQPHNELELADSH